MVSRRNSLRFAGTGLFGLAGCLGGDASATPTDTEDVTPSPADGTTPANSPTGTPHVGVEVDGADPAWVSSLDGTVRTDPVAVDGRIAVVVGTTVHALDAETGETAWTFDSPVSPDRDVDRPTATLREHDGTLYALVGVSFGTGASDHVLHALTPDGEEEWTYESGVGGFHDLVGFGDGAAVLATSDDAIGDADSGGHPVLAVDLADGSERWRTESADGMGGSVGDEYAVVRGYGWVDCFDVGTGERRFRFEPDDDRSLEATAVGGGHVFVGVRPGEDGPALYALAPDGSTDWSRSDRFVGSLRYLDELYVGGAAVKRVDPDGSRRWSYDGGGLLTGVPFDDGALYTNAAERVVALDRETGEERWATDATELAIPRARGGDAVVSSDGQARVALAHDVHSGEELWRASLPDEYPPSPVADGSGAYLATAHGAVVKVPF